MLFHLFLFLHLITLVSQLSPASPNIFNNKINTILHLITVKGGIELPQIAENRGQKFTTNIPI